MTSIPDNIRKEIWDYFGDYQAIYLATADGNKPRVRPVTLAYLNSKFWVFTGTKNAKVKQIRANPKFEFCCPLEKGKHSGYVRAYGTTNIVQDKETKEQMANRCEYFEQHWKGPDDPDYTLLELRIEEVEYLKPGEMLAQRYQL